MALLKEAERLSNEGLYAKANESIANVLKESNDAEVINRSRSLLEANNPSLPAKLGLSRSTLLTMASWWVDLSLGILMLLALYALLKLARHLWSLTQRDKWRLEPIADTSNAGVADVIIESLGSWDRGCPPLNSGLLTLERLQLPSVDWKKPSTTTLDLAEALKDFSIKIGGIGLSGIAGAGRGTRNWLNLKCPAIRGRATVSGPNLIVSLTARSAKGNVFAVTESRTTTSPAPAPGQTLGGYAAGVGAPSVASSFSPEDVQGAAQSASYKIFYLISRQDSTLAEAEAANGLREGMNLLWEHVSTQHADKLGKAYEKFRQARTQKDDFYDAYLYEGIALDLLSRHDEAIKRFGYLENEQRLKDTSLREKATYNRAISLFRKYQYPAAREAERVLDCLIGDIAPGAEISQIKAMALAAKASVVAQYPIYWVSPVPEGEDSAVLELESETAGTRWIDQVASLKKQLEGILETVQRGGKWDRGAERQLEWAINNAWGSVHLNCATYVYATADANSAPAKWKEKRSDYLQIAYDAFQNCAMLLTPGVENLTNLAKVAFELGRFAQGCAYLEEAISMNASYEYAHFRLAKEWDKKNETARIVKLLKPYLEKRTPIIPAFVKLVEKYKNELSK